MGLEFTIYKKVHVAVCLTFFGHSCVDTDISVRD